MKIIPFRDDSGQKVKIFLIMDIEEKVKMNLYSVECPVGFQTWNMLNAIRAPAIRLSRFELGYLRKDEVLLFQRISTWLHL